MAFVLFDKGDPPGTGGGEKAKILPMDATLPKSESKAGSLTVVGVRLFSLKPFLQGERGHPMPPNPQGEYKEKRKIQEWKMKERTAP
jgi:hypothetical protein